MKKQFKVSLLVAATTALAAAAVPAHAAWESFDGAVTMVSGVKPYPSLVLIRRLDNYVTEVSLGTAAGLTQAQVDQCEARVLQARAGGGSIGIDGNVSSSVVSTGVPVNGTSVNRSVTLSTMTGCVIR